MKVSERIEIRRLRGATVAKLITLGGSLGLGTFCALLSLPASMGVEIIRWNGEYLSGPWALIAAPLIGAFMGFLIGLFFSIPVYLGLRVYALLRPFSIEYIASDADTSDG